MTVSVQTNRDEFTGNGVTTDFATTFEFQTGTDLKVYLDGVLKTITTHYTVSGGAGSTGTVTFLTAPADTLEVVIYDDPPVTQGTDYTPNDAFPAESHELALDKLTRIARTLKSRVGRAAVLSDFDTSGADTTLPAPSSRRAIVWNTAADGFENSTYDPDEEQAGVAANAAAAAASAAAAAISESNAATSESNAATSESNADTARIAAETAETNAETAEANAEAAAIAQGMPFVFDTTTAMADPGAGKIRLNHATPASATAIALDDADAETRDLSAYIATWDDSTNTNKGTLVITKSGGSDFAIYTITGLTDNAGWTQLAVTYIAGAGTISNADRVYLGFSRTGDAGSASASSIQVQGYTRFAVGGTADAMTGTLSPAITGYTAGLRVTTTPGGANTVTGPTLNLNSLGTKTIKKRNSGGTKVALAAGDYNASGPFDFEYDGTDFILMNTVTAADDVTVSLLMLEIADLQNQAQVMGPTGNRFADSFDALTYVDTGAATNLNTGTAGKLMPTVAASTKITGGSNIGNMTNSGGLAAAFDNNTNQANTASAQGSAGVAAYVGKTPATAKRIASLTAYPANGTSTIYWNTGNNADTITLTLYGKTGAAPANATDGTAIGTTNFANGTTASRSITSTDQTTAFDHVWLTITSSAYAGGSLVCAEAEFYEVGATNNLTVASTALTAASAPTTMSALMRVDYVDTPTLNTDLMLDVSRDGGTTWTTSTLSLAYTAPGSVKVLTTNSIDVSGQPSGTSPKWRIRTDNNKMVHVRDVYLYWS